LRVHGHLQAKRLGFLLLDARRKLLVGDSGQFILVEQHCEQRGSVKTFHWKIPYNRVVRLNGTDPDSELALI